MISPKRDIKPMLAKDTTFEKETKPALAQPKLNGVRGIFCPDEGILRSRQGKQILSCPHIEEEIKSLGLGEAWLDGEIFLHGVPFQDLNGMIRREYPEPTLELHVFDLIDVSMPQSDRLRVLKECPWGLHVKLVPWVFLPSEEFKDAFDQVVSHGYEGLILRTPTALYQHKRTKDLRRIKPSFFVLSKLVGFNPAVGDRNKSTFGSLRLVDTQGRPFNCSGLTDVQRKLLWSLRPIGQQVEIECGAFSKNGTPIFPRFKRLVKGDTSDSINQT